MTIKIFETGDAERPYGIGVFDPHTDEMLKGNSPRYFKNRKTAERALRRLHNE